MKTRFIIAVAAVCAAALCQSSAMAKTFVIPHILEKSGLTTDTQFTFDTTIFITYSGGLTGAAKTKSATVDVYLYDDSGNPLRSKTGQDVCNPCSYSFGASQAGAGVVRKQSIRIDDLITAKGGFASDSVTGFVVIVVKGHTPGVNISGFIVNSHTSAFDLSISPLDVQLLGGTN